MNVTRAWVGCALFVLFSGPVRAAQTDPDTLSYTLPDSSYREAMIAPFAYHWRNESDHKHVVMLGLERGLSVHGFGRGVLPPESKQRGRAAFPRPSGYT